MYSSRVETLDIPSIETESAETMRDIDLYALYRIRHQPDELLGFIQHVVAAANNPRYEQTMRPVLEAITRYLSKFGVVISDDPIETARTVYPLLMSEDLPAPETIPPVDLSTCYESITMDNGVLMVDYSLNRQWQSSGDPDAALFLEHLGMATGGYRDTKLRVFSDVHPAIEEQFKQEFGTTLKVNQFDPEVSRQLGEHFGLKDLMTKYKEIFWAFHGYAGNIDTFKEMFKTWVSEARTDTQRPWQPFTCVAMEGLGANGSIIEQHYREIYDIEPDRVTLPRYGQGQFAAYLASGVAGNPEIKKRLIGYSMGAAGLRFAKDIMVSQELQMREFDVAQEFKRNPPQTYEEQALRAQSAQLGPHEALSYFPNTSNFFLNPVYRKRTVMAGVYPDGAPLQTKARALASRAAVEIARYTGRNGIDHMPGIARILNIGTRYLIGGRGSNISDTVDHHGRNIRTDEEVIGLQGQELRLFDGMSLPQMIKGLQDYEASFYLLGREDRITPPELQRQAISEELKTLESHGYNYVEPIILEVPTGHGLPFDDFMRKGYNLVGILGDLNVEDRALLRSNIQLVQEAINGTLSTELKTELAQLAYYTQQFKEKTQTIEPHCSPEEYRHRYPTVIGAPSRGTLTISERSQYITELMKLFRCGSDRLLNTAKRCRLPRIAQLFNREPVNIPTSPSQGQHEFGEALLSV